MNARAAAAKVTVIVTTYNHERFIAEAIDGVLMQDTNFAYDVVIIEDCSTDRTRDIVTAYQHAHPDKIRLVLPEVNKCSNAELMKVLDSTSSPYVAILDGDDYWTSRHKLQKQVDYLDRHPGCTICFHNVRVVQEDGSQEPRHTQYEDQKEISTLEDLLEGCFIATCSAVIRQAVCSQLPSWYTDDPCGDWSLFLRAANHGTIGYLSEVLAVYRLHPSGMWTGKSRVEQLQLVIEFYEHLPGRLPAQYTARIGTLLARAWYELALEHEQARNSKAAQQCYDRCARVEPDSRRFKWTLRVAGGSVAKLVFQTDDANSLRIAIENAAAASYDIQLNQPYLTVQANHPYSVQFRARADSPRSLVVGFAQAHDPWAGLGLHTRVALTTEWQQFEERFVALADDKNGRIHFDAGDSSISVELGSVVLRSGAQSAVEQQS